MLDRARGEARPADGATAGTGTWAAVEGDDGTVWLGTAEGVFRVPPGAAAGVFHRVDPARSGYVFNFVRALFIDRAGVLWVGTHGGLYRHDPHAKPFRHLAGDPDHPRALSSSALSAITEADGALWVGTLGAGLNRLDRRTGAVRRFRHRPEDPGSIPDDVIWSLLGARALLGPGRAAGLGGVRDPE